jgi:ABC-2 type transport system ATP-binding protein
MIRELGEKHTILLSTHILPEVEEVCQRVIVINQGRVALQDRLDNLQRDTLIVVEVRGPADKVRETLQKTDGVTQVTAMPIDQRGQADSIVGFEVRTTDNRDLRLAIADRLTKQGWTLRRLDIRRRTLREHFMRVTMGAGRE